MYFWRVKRLKVDLQSARLPDVEGLKYVMATTAAWMLLIELATWEPIEKSAAYAVGAVATLLIALFGTYAAYAANGGASGVDFLGRFVSLSWVVGVRVVAAMLAVIIAVTVAYTVADPTSLDNDGPLFPAEDALYVLIAAVNYWRIAVHMRSLRAGEGSLAVQASADAG